MHPILESICIELEQLASATRSTLPNEQSFGIASGNWTFPNLTRDELARRAERLRDDVKEQAVDDLGEWEGNLSTYPARLQFLRGNVIPNLWSNAQHGVPAYMLTLDALREAVRPLTTSSAQDAAAALRKAKLEVRALEARLADLSPRTQDLNSKVERIVSAAEAADRLPVDLQELEAGRKAIELARSSVDKNAASVALSKEAGETTVRALNAMQEEAQAVLEKCEHAYATATSQGLAAAFNTRSEELQKSMWFWIGGLVAALVAGTVLGSRQLLELSRLVADPNTSGIRISLNMVLAALSVGAPVWFAWLATKQIGQRFRLAEDYAYKASISSAYQGYSKETRRVDPNLEARLLASALDRLDELPLRWVESKSHGSPMHDLVSSEAVATASRTVPGFAAQVVELAKSAITRKATVVPAAAVRPEIEG